MIWTAKINGVRLDVRAGLDGERCTSLAVEARPYGQPLPAMVHLTFAAVSVGLANGVSLTRFARTLMHRRDETGGEVEGDAFVTEAGSIVDYVFKACIARGLK